MLHFNRMESVGCYALCYAARPAGVGQLQASASGDAGSEMARSMLGGNIDVIQVENKNMKALDKCRCEMKWLIFI